MNEKQINKWLRKRFSPVGWTLVGYYVLMNILVSVAMLRDVIAGYLNAFIEGNDQYVPDVSALTGNAWGYIAAVAVALVTLYAWKGREFWGGEVLRREKPMKPGTLLCMVCLCAGTQMVNFVWINLLELVMNCFGRSATGTLDAVSGSSDTVSMFLYASFLAPISEELIFRGFVLRSLRPYGKRFAILGSAFLFGLFHGNLLQTPYAFLVGLVLGYVAVEYSVGWSMVLHIFNNLVLADLLSRLTANLPEVAASVLELTIFTGFFAAAVAILIANRARVRAYIQSEWIDRRCLKCFFFQCRCDRSDGSDGNKHDDSAVRIMRTALSSWLTKVNPQLCRGQKNSFQRGVKQTEKKLLIIAEVVYRPHNYDNEEVSLVKEAQARPSEMLDDILMPKPRLLREKA